MKKLSMLFAAALLGAHAHATSSADLAPEIYGNGSKSTTTPSPTPTPGTTQFPTYMTPAPKPTPTPTATTTPTPAANASINPSANQGQQSQSGGSGANAAAGAALIAAGMALMSNPPTVPAGAALIAMGMLALAQSDHDGNAANQSAATGASSYQGSKTAGTGSGTTAATNPALGTGTSAFNTPAVKEAQAALADAGYTVTPTGLQTPDGSTIPNSAFNSSGGMASAGMSADQIKAVQAALGKVNGDTMAKIASVDVSTSGGGGGEGSANSATKPDFSFGAKANPFGMTDAAKKAMIAGKTVNFDGDPIGVRGNNIFDMIHVAYQKKQASHDFLDGGDSGGIAPASVTLRQPASSNVPTLAPQGKVGGPSRAVINNR